MNRSILKRYSAAIIILAAMSVGVMLHGCGGGGGGMSAPAAPAAKSGGTGKIAAAVTLTGRAGNRQLARPATGTVSVTISIDGYYSLDGKPFPTVTTTADLDLSKTVAKISVLDVPIGVNHVLTAVANWGDATETVKALVPEVREGQTITVTADHAGAVIVDTAIYHAQQQGKTLPEISAATIQGISAAVAAMAANGTQYYDMQPQQVLAYAAGMNKPASLSISPATATVQAGGSYQFTAALYDGNRAHMTGATFTWSFTPLASGNIGGSGLLTAMNAGSGIVTVSYGSLSATAAVTVTALCLLDADCSDGNSLTIDTCAGPGTPTASCSHAPFSCNVNSDCGTSKPFCVNGGGASSLCATCISDANCDDGNARTIDSCSSPSTASAACAHASFACNVNSDCGSGTPYCVNGGGASSLCAACTSDINCDDSNASTIDTCSNPGTANAACAHSQIACLTNAECNDNNPLTIDACANPGAANSNCTHTAYSCNTNPDCGAGNPFCVNGGGLASLCAACLLDDDCVDSNPLTLSSCLNPGTSGAACAFLPFACNANGDCGAGTPFCVNGGGLTSLCAACLANTDCNDNNALTLDSCLNPGAANAACANMAIACNTAGDCNDNNALTEDGCTNGGAVNAACTHTAYACNTNTDCAPGAPFCFNGGGVSSFCSACTGDDDCDDSNPLTIDACTNPSAADAACSNTAYACNTSSDCGGAEPVCYNGGDAGSLCIACSTVAECDDGNVLTIDDCMNGDMANAACTHAAIACNTNSDCGVSTPFCIDSGLVSSFCTACNADPDCDDGSPLTADTCVDPGAADSSCSHVLDTSLVPVEVNVISLAGDFGSGWVDDIILNAAGTKLFGWDTNSNSIASYDLLNFTTNGIVSGTASLHKLIKDPNSDTAYSIGEIPDEGPSSYELDKIDLSSDTIVNTASITSGGGYYGYAVPTDFAPSISKTRNELYTQSFDETGIANVSVVNLSSFAEEAFVPTTSYYGYNNGNYTGGVAAVDDANAKLFMTNGDGPVTALDLASRTSLPDTAIDPSPNSFLNIAVRRVNGTPYLYALRDGPNILEVYNLNDNSLQCSVSGSNLGYPVIGIFDPLNHIYINNNQSESVEVYNGSDCSLVTSLPTTNEMYGFTSDPVKGVVYISHNDNTISVLEYQPDCPGSCGCGGC